MPVRATLRHIHMAVLGRIDAQSVNLFSTRIFKHAAAQAAFREIRVAENGEEPGPKICSFLETLEVIPGFEECFLDQIIGLVRIAAERNSEGSEIRYQRQQGFPQ